MFSVKFKTTLLSPNQETVYKEKNNMCCKNVKLLSFVKHGSLTLSPYLPRQWWFSEAPEPFSSVTVSFAPHALSPPKIISKLKFFSVIKIFFRSLNNGLLYTSKMEGPMIPKQYKYAYFYYLLDF